MAYIIQQKRGPKAKWLWLQGSPSRFATEAEAWAHVASLDEDGYIDRAQFRVIKLADKGA